MVLTFPGEAKLDVEGFSAWTANPQVVTHQAGTSVPGAPEWKHPVEASDAKQPILTGSTEIKSQPLYLTIDRVTAGGAPAMSDPAKAFAARSAQVDAIAQQMKIDTPDEYINAAGPALGDCSRHASGTQKQELHHARRRGVAAGARGLARAVRAGCAGQRTSARSRTFAIG